MGVYIKGMEMPKSCAKCELFGEYGCPFIGAVGYALTKGKRNEDCPLVPVPDHGRLIDADAMREAVGEVELKARKEYYELSDAEKECEYEMGVWDGLHMAAKILSTTPTIIPADKEAEK